MANAIVIWDEDDDLRGNVQHLAEHGITKDEADEVLLDPDNPTGTSRTSGNPMTFGWTTTGKHIVVIWENVLEDPKTIYPLTAYEVPPPAAKRKGKRK